MIKRCDFTLHPLDDFMQDVRDNMLQLFNDIETREWQFCAIGHSRDEYDFQIVAYFFRTQEEMNDFIFFRRLINDDNRLIPNDSEELYMRLLNATK